MSTTTENLIATLPERPRYRDDCFGLIVVPNDQGWKFGSPSAQPPGELGNTPTIIAVEFAVIFNRSEWGRQKRQWAVVTENGGLLRIKNIDPAERPSDPTAFPPGARICCGQEAAELATEENRERHRLAAVPREWTVAIRPLRVRLRPDSEPASTIEVFDVALSVETHGGGPRWLVGRVGKVDWFVDSEDDIAPTRAVLRRRREALAAPAEPELLF
jgi:hypothetical protein